MDNWYWIKESGKNFYLFYCTKETTEEDDGEFILRFSTRDVVYKLRDELNAEIVKYQELQRIKKLISKVKNNA